MTPKQRETPTLAEQTIAQSIAEDGPPHQRRVHCINCGADVTSDHWMCDKVDGQWCPSCFDLTACGNGAHGEGCPTQVFETT